MYIIDSKTVFNVLRKIPSVDQPLKPYQVFHWLSCVKWNILSTNLESDVKSAKPLKLICIQKISEKHFPLFYNQTDKTFKIRYTFFN